MVDFADARRLSRPELGVGLLEALARPAGVVLDQVDPVAPDLADLGAGELECPLAGGRPSDRLAGPNPPAEPPDAHPQPADDDHEGEQRDRCAALGLPARGQGRHLPVAGFPAGHQVLDSADTTRARPVPAAVRAWRAPACIAATPSPTLSASGIGPRSGAPASGSAGRTGTSVRCL